MWYLAVYGVISASNSLVTLVRSFLFAYGGLRAADRMHASLLASVLNVRKRDFDILSKRLFLVYSIY